ncbi:hypothetical protein MRB53_003027 [Persea americana]|uniref:Uncharacterized protein n=1 Tax=Persea americana TaxID=3435 RepID=A0ACC2MWF3_PERAE|nr:hypothetical protein MRB53_003027 [Persea americana]|eukprot:TRINITY_DN8888_c0_g1_i3.p1 TRINITY_DN8888_c0_g1~~TRINITY_DN8888_c0_g1_i3.p1  ORF type:complete len:259 (-),score=53.96 TRINITY_DN8888_c0_g1_i3:446-1222(-)
MLVEKEDLGLSLSLRSSSSENRHPLQLNLMPWNDLFASTERSSETIRPFLKGIDVNRKPSTVDCEDEAGISSPNSTVSSVSGKRSEREPSGGDGISDDEDGGETSRKKLRLSKEQSAVLEESFKEHTTLNPKQKLALSKQLYLRPRQVEVWFQNRRARTKLKQTEVDCELMKRCCESLKEENRRLQKEVQELRALKLSPHLYMHMTPPTTLTLCPSCERVAATVSDQAAPHRHQAPISIPPWAQPAAPFIRALDVAPH